MMKSILSFFSKQVDNNGVNTVDATLTPATGATTSASKLKRATSSADRPNTPKRLRRQIPVVTDKTKKDDLITEIQYWDPYAKNLGPKSQEQLCATLALGWTLHTSPEYQAMMEEESKKKVKEEED